MARIEHIQDIPEKKRNWWKDILYESLNSANVYTPEQYPTGWKIEE